MSDVFKESLIANGVKVSVKYPKSKFEKRKGYKMLMKTDVTDDAQIKIDFEKVKDIKKFNEFI